MVTLATFLGQIFAEDHSCQAALDRLIAWRAARGLPACSADTGGYCKARQRLPEALLPRLARDTADRVGGHAPEGWQFHGRRVVLADGTSVSMPDTPENQREYPQPRQQKAGCGFPIARVVVLICLATGCVLDAAIGGARGKLTGEHALLRGLHGRLRPGDILVADAYYSSSDEVLTLRRLGGGQGRGGGGGGGGGGGRGQPAGPTSAAAHGWAARTTRSSGTVTATGGRG